MTNERSAQCPEIGAHIRDKLSGCSNAAKWPPFGISDQWRMSVKRPSIQRRTGGTISFGYTAT
jgi:hypothetical protein